MSRLLLDQGLPRSAARCLRERGVDILHVCELGMHSAADAEILAFARAEQRLVVTLDADFHTLLALSNAASPSVIRLRIEGLKGDAAAELIERVLSQTAAVLRSGAAVVVTPFGIRVKRLPILGGDNPA